MVGFWLLCLLIGTLGFYLYKRHSVPKGFPPGPWGVPYFGYLPFLAQECHLTFHELAKKYGPVIGLRLGHFRVVILNDYNSIKEAFKNDAFLAKGKHVEYIKEYGGRITKDHAHGVLLSEGSEWQEQRRFTLRHLRDLGFGKRTMEDKLEVELKELIEGFKSESPGPCEITSRFTVVAINALFEMCVGERYNQNDQFIKDMAAGIESAFIDVVYPGAFFVMPELTWLFPKYFEDNWNKFIKSIKDMIDFMDIRVTEHEKTYQEDTMRDFTDMYLREIKGTTDPNSTFYGEHGKQSLLTVLMDLFAAGAHTTSTGLAWALLYLIYHPEKMKKLQKELDIVVGKDRTPSLDDRKNLPYTEAVINETLRLAVISALGGIHATARDIHFQGHFIPKDTMVFGNLYPIMHDPKVFKDPEEFIPERFIDEFGKCKVDSEVVPFGLGKRSCPGESLARVQIFYFLTGLLQRFNFSPVKGEPLPTLKPKVGSILVPKSYKLMVTDRIIP